MSKPQHEIYRHFKGNNYLYYVFELNRWFSEKIDMVEVLKSIENGRPCFRNIAITFHFLVDKYMHGQFENKR